MIQVDILLILLATHWVADFVAQSDWMATNKSNNIYALSIHVAAYTAILAVVSCTVFGFTFNAVTFILLNCLLHFMIDMITSKISSYLWGIGSRHWFFVAIGFDQFLHQVCIVLTMMNMK